MVTIAFSGAAALAGYDDPVWGAFLNALAALRPRLPESSCYRFLHGDALGADRIIASRLAAGGRHEVIAVPADWAAHGRHAGWLRNEQLIDQADAYIAIWDGVSAGTLHAAGLALARGIPWQCRIIAPPTAGTIAHPEPWDEADRAATAIHAAA